MSGSSSTSSRAMRHARSSLELEAVDQERPARPQARQLAVGARRDRLGLGMRVEDGQLVALVLEEPDRRVDLELVAVRRGERVPAAHVALGDTVAEDEQAAALVRRLLGGVRAQLGADRGRDYHQSTASSISSPRPRTAPRGTSSRRRRARRRRPSPRAAPRRCGARRGRPLRPRRRRRSPRGRAAREPRRRPRRSRRAACGRASTTSRIGGT